MKFSKIVKNIITEQSEVENIIADCQPYIKANKDVIINENGWIWRGSNRQVNGVVKIPSRTRKRIKGNPLMFYYYETIKPSRFPSRRAMVPGQGYNVSSTFSNFNTYVVIPIGSNYKLVYAKGIRDFNYNELFMGGGAPRLRHGIQHDLNLMEEYIEGVKEYPDEKPGYPPYEDMTDEWFPYLKIIKDKFSGLWKKDTLSMFKTVKSYIETLEGAEDEIHGIAPATFRTLDRVKDVMTKYFGRANVTKSLNSNMKDVEVSVYSPDGFYYVEPSFVKKIEDKLQ